MKIPGACEYCACVSATDHRCSQCGAPYQKPIMWFNGSTGTYFLAPFNIPRRQYDALSPVMGQPITEPYCDPCLT